MKIIYIDKPMFAINKNGDILNESPTHDVGSGWRKSIDEIRKLFKNKKESKFLCIYAPNEMLRPYYKSFNTSTEGGIQDMNVVYGGWIIRYIILDENLKTISD